jgi:7,8-dihydropterin-6-yl-methyl-4-(beta-D-ribofuranosyl)aminobenzene 5'-phosphate synthase
VCWAVRSVPQALLQPPLVPSSEGPYQPGPGCWTTGAVPRLSFEQAGTPPALAYREGDEFIRDYIDDDQSIVINVKDKGLVVVSGCAHSGIVNTVNYAREVSGVDTVWAIIGGFHLDRAEDEDIQRTIDAIKKLKPAMVVPMHCTGFKAISQFAIQMPDEFVLGVVGTKYLF